MLTIWNYLDWRDAPVKNPTIFSNKQVTAKRAAKHQPKSILPIQVLQTRNVSACEFTGAAHQ